MPDETEDPRLAAQGELALARAALDAGELSDAAAYLAGALGHAPTMPEVHEVLARLRARTGDGTELFPLDRPAFVGAVVARAHLLAAGGRPDEGLELLVAATAHDPGMDWAAVPWVTDPELVTRIGPENITGVLMRLCAAVAEPAPAPQRAALAPYLLLARHAVAAYPQHALLCGAASAYARRLGETGLAVRWAQQGVAAQPSKLGEVWLGYAHRSAGHTNEALAALRRAVDHDPDDLSVYTDIAGTLADNGRLAEAMTWVERALARDPGFDCAVHTAQRLRYRRDGDVRHLIALADFQREHPDRTHEHTDLAECCRQSAWLGIVPAASESIIDVLRQLSAATEPVTAGRLRLSELEVPSAMRTLATAAPGLELLVERISAPDLRLPRRPQGRLLWRYDGTTAQPALPAPSAAAAERLRHLAQPGWPHPPAAYDAAVSLATVEVDDLLGLLLHPPRPPETPLGRALAEHDPALWHRTVQVWACLGLLHHRTDEAWESSARRELLLGLVWGVEDWITEAALFALVTAAWVDPTVRDDVAEVVAERFRDALAVARQRPSSITWSLARLAMITPGIDPKVAELARRLFPDTGPRPRRRRRGWWARLRRRLRRRR
ncbi:tetratricopeptide repeat protein [Melissospora conviva]|uniref:tetratricopeptide repeat protein n=1 Tax=Melissospora conviva TaxID=3388432 RepID=UPI003C23AE2A